MRCLSAVLTMAIVGGAVFTAEAQTGSVTRPAVLITPLPERGVVRSGVVGGIVMNDAAIVDRILSFDTDGDGRVAAEELPERMEALLPRLDADGDGFVTAEEVRKRVNGIPPVARGGVITGQVARPPALADVVNDLKLPEAVRLHALQIVQGYMVPQGANDPASPDLAVVYAAMRHLLDDEDYGNFVAAVTRHGARRFVVSNSVSTNPPVRERGSTPAPPSPPR